MNKRRILIVEDEYLIASYLAFSLAEMGFDVPQMVPTGEESLIAANEIHPDVILMDIILPGRMNGIDAAAEIQSSLDIPVIFLTANDELEMVKRAGETHPYGYLLKPVRSVELYSAIETALHRHSLESRLRESHKMLNLAQQVSGTGSWSMDFKSGILSCSDQMLHLLRIDADNFNGTIESAIKNIHPDDLLDLTDEGNKIIRFYEPRPHEFRVIFPDGTNSILLAEGKFETDELGGIIRLTGYARDITQEKIYEKAILESEKQYRLVVENINEGLWVIDRNSVTTFVNNRLAKMLGYTPDEMLGKDIFSFMDSEEAKIVRRNISHLYQGQVDQADLSFIKKNGSIIFTHISTGPVISEDGKYVGAIAGVIDITDRKNAETEIIRLNRHILNLQEEERQKVSKDLHDSVGQILLAAKMNFEMFRKDPAHHSECFDIGIDFLARSSNELREIFTNLYPSILNEFGLGETIRWYAENSLNKTGLKTELNISVNRELPHDLETNVYRIVQELFANILKHSKAGKVCLDLSSDNDVLSLTVKDDGVGLCKCSDESHSSGNGLVNIQQRVENARGSLNITSAPGKGTVVTIDIPLK